MFNSLLEDAKMMNEVNLVPKLKMKCKSCGKELKAEYDPSTSQALVEPCPVCIGKAFDAGLEERK